MPAKPGNAIKKDMKKWKNVLVISVLIVLAISCAQKTAPPAAAGPITVKVGLPTPLSNPDIPWGRANVEPYQTWLDLFNKKGFQVNGKTYNFKLFTADDRDSPEGGTVAAKQLVYGDGCRFLAGHWSWSYDTISAITNPAKVIFVTRDGGGIVYDATTQPYNVFGTPAKEEWVNQVLAAHEKFPGVKFGILEPASGLTQSEIEQINRQSFDPAGMNYQWEIFPAGTTDFTTYITRFADGGCGLVYTDTGIDSTLQFVKQRWDAGYKWPVGQAGGLAEISVYMDACGYDAVQGLIGGYFGIWDFKKTRVNAENVDMCQEVMNTLSDSQGRPYSYTDWIGWLPSHLLILAQAMEKAGTVEDTDAIMKAIRGGTFDTTAGKFTMSGEKTYGSPIVFGCPCAICIIDGDKAVYLSEYPLKSIP
jgi:ABC-type branched-subunit amino acid transport system substrate-binding protein